MYLPEKDINHKKEKYAIIMAMIQLLKFDIRLFRYERNIYFNKTHITDMI